MGMLPITTSTSDELSVVSTLMTLKDPELPKYGGVLLIFAIFGCSTHSKNELQGNGWR